MAIRTGCGIFPLRDGLPMNAADVLLDGMRNRNFVTSQETRIAMALGASRGHFRFGGRRRGIGSRRHAVDGAVT